MMSKPVLPVQQLTILALCRFAEPLSLLSILPYLPEMIQSFGIPKNNIGLWTGIMMSSYSACECIAAIPWSILSDRFGRRPIILLSLTITMITSLIWGFSTSLEMALSARVVAGLGNGVAGIIRTMVAEICPWKELQPIAFSIMPVVYNLGAILGPIFGGALSNPYHLSPTHKKPARPGLRLFEKFPYALPNIVAAAIFKTGIIIGLLFLRETLPGRKDKLDVGLRLGERLTAGTRPLCIGLKDKVWSKWGKREERKPLLRTLSSESTYVEGESSDFQDCEEAPPTIPETPEANKNASKTESIWQIVFAKQSCLNLAVYGVLCMQSLSYDQMLPVFMHHPVQDNNGPDVQLPFKFGGGLGIETSRISILFTLYGILNMSFQLLVFPRLVKYFSILPCLRIFTILYTPLYILTPFTSLLSSPFLQQSALLVLWSLKGLCSSVTFPTSIIIMTNSVIDKKALARLNGVAVVVSSLARAIGPAVLGPLFSWGVGRGVIGVPFWCLAVVTALGAVPAFWLKERGGDEDESEVGHGR